MPHSRFLIPAWITLAMAGLGLAGLSAGDLDDPSATPELAYTIPWSSPEGLGLIKGGAERPTQGPTAAAVGPDNTLWILDDVNGRLAGYDRDGGLISTLPVAPHHHALVAVAPDGSFALVALHLRRIERLDATGAPLPDLALPLHLGPPRALGFGAQGELELVNAHGQRFSLGQPDDPRPLREAMADRHHGPPGSKVECGLRMLEGRAWFKRWLHPEGPTTGREPDGFGIGFDLDGAAAARLVSVCHAEPVLLETETLRHGTRVDVDRRVISVADGKVLDTWDVPPDWLYVPIDRFARSPGETLMIHPVKQGLQVWRWRTP